MSVKTVAVTDSTFAQEVLESTVPVLVDFWAEWCGPCRTIAPVVDELADTYAGRVRFVKVDVDENPDTAARYAVRSIPSLMFFHAGSIKDQLVGAVPNLRKEIASRLDTLLTS